MGHIQINIQGNLKEAGYLFFVKHIAGIYGINRFAKYKGDGSVWINAEGHQDSLKHFTEFLRVGTYNSRIESFENIEMPFENLLSFEIQ